MPIVPSPLQPLPDGPLSEEPLSEEPLADGALVQAVLWDMDGTIVDTEPYWIQAEKDLVASYGGTWTEEQAEALVGQALTFSGQVIQDAGVDLTVREIIDRLISQVASRVRQEMPWRPGARELLEELRERSVPCALVTMSEKLLAKEIEAQLPEGTFHAVVTGDMVTHGKPHPEAYERAFKHLARSTPSLALQQCVAIEDSLPGVTAAQAAGLTTIAVPHFVPLPHSADRTEWKTLAGRSLQDLEAVVAAKLATEGAAR